MKNVGIEWDLVEKESTEMLSKYLQINTTNPPGNETAGAEFLKDILERESMACDIYESAPGRGSLISKYCGEKSNSDIILLHHIDVVPAEEKKWEHPPFSGLVIDGEIWGRGAIDCKSLGIMELMAIVLLKRQGFFPEKQIVYVAVADEEAGSKYGIPWLMKKYPDKFLTEGIINEGVGLGFSTAKSNLYFCQIAEKEACWIRINFEGRPGHGSLPHNDNCVIDMARAINAISSCSFPVCVTEPAEKFISGLSAEQTFMPQHEFLGMLDKSCFRNVLDKIPIKSLRRMLTAILQNTAVPTVAHAGNKTNVIPGECYCEVDCRILPGQEPEEFMKTLEGVLTKAGCKNFSIDFTGKQASPESSTDNPIYRALEESFKKNDPKSKVIPFMSTGATDSRFFREKGIPAYGIQIQASIESAERVHGHNERISSEGLVMGIKVLYDTVKKFCA